MSRPAITRTTVAIVVLPLAAVAWYVATWFCGPYWVFDLLRKGYAFTPQEPPRGDVLAPFSREVMWEQAGAPGLVLIALGAAMAAAFLVGAVGSWRGPLSRRMSRLPLRIGLLALILGLAGAAAATATEVAVQDRLGLHEHWLGTDRSTIPWGERALLLGGSILALAGMVLTAGLALLSSLLARRTAASKGEAR